jgi:mevalonate kinase
MYARFSGKILLFGEYTVISGSQALVTPLKSFSGQLRIPGSDWEKATAREESNHELKRFFKYLSGVNPEESSGMRGGTRISTDSLLDMDSLSREIERGLFFDSSIPRGYGAGSSAALVAAVYGAFAWDRIRESAADPCELSQLRQYFALMESLFHGTSSGIDPVCCYTCKTIFVNGPSLEPVSIPAFRPECRFFLLDAGTRGETGPLVTGYKRRLAEDNAFASMLDNFLVPLVEDCIGKLLAGSQTGMAASLRKLSHGQLDHFGPMIPDMVRELWLKGLEARTYTLKLCGSGGGGFYLGFAENWEEASLQLEKTGMGILPLDL